MKYTLPDAIITARYGLGITQHDLAKRMRVNQSTVSQWESGKRTPSLRRLAVLQKVLKSELKGTP